MVAVLTWLAVFTAMLLTPGATTIAGAFAVVPLWIAIRWLVVKDASRTRSRFEYISVIIHGMLALLIFILAVGDRVSWC